MFNDKGYRNAVLGYSERRREAMATQRRLEPHPFVPYADAGHICRHCDGGEYAACHGQSDATMKTTSDERPQTMCEAGTCGHPDCRERLWAKKETTSEIQVQSIGICEGHNKPICAECGYCILDVEHLRHTQPLAGEREEWAADDKYIMRDGIQIGSFITAELATIAVHDHAAAGLVGELVAALEQVRAAFFVDAQAGAYVEKGKLVPLDDKQHPWIPGARAPEVIAVIDTVLTAARKAGL